MAKTYRVRYQGKILKVKGPDNATPEQLRAHVEANYKAPEPVISDSGPKEPRDPVGMVTNAASRALSVPFQGAKTLATDPRAQANALPLLLGGVGSVAGPLGAGLGTTGGVGIRNAALTALGDREGGSATEEVAKAVGSGIGAAAGQKFLGLGLRGARVAGALGSKNIAGNRLEALERAAGLNTKLPTAPASTNEGVARQIAELQNTANAAKSGQVPLQEIKNQYDLAGDIISKVKGKNKALATQAKEGLSKILNESIPGRTKAAQTFKDVLTYQKIAKPALAVGGVTGLASILGSKLINAVRGPRESEGGYK